MKYLDRAARVGDRVVVRYEGVVDNVVDASSGYMEVRVRPADGRAYFANLDAVSVIAPEPKVGDVVTADMDLPEGSIIECNTGRYFGVAILNTGTWWRDSQTSSQPVFTQPNWRIVRIGGAT